MPAKARPHVKIVRPTRGGVYHYFDTGQRKPSGAKIYKRLPAPGARDYEAVYAGLLSHRVRRDNIVPALSLKDLVRLYLKSPDFTKLSDTTQQIYEGYLVKLQAAFAGAPANDLQRRDMRRLMDDMAKTPGAANLMLASTAALYRWGRKREHVTAKPCDEIERFELGEHEPWPDHILAAGLEADDPIVRLGVHLLYFTAQRIGDVVKMRWSDIRDGRIEMEQEKTGRVMSIALHRDLGALLASTDKAALTILSYEGRPVKHTHLRRRLQDFASAIGAKVVPHGLRKNAVNALLECGCSVAETAAISGQSLALVEYYAKRRNTQKLGDAAILRWEGVQK